MFASIRENISPTITAAAVILTTLSIIMLATMEGLRRRNERLKGNNMPDRTAGRPVARS